VSSCFPPSYHTETCIPLISVKFSAAICFNKHYMSQLWHETKMCIMLLSEQTLFLWWIITQSDACSVGWKQEHLVYTQMSLYCFLPSQRGSYEIYSIILPVCPVAIASTAILKHYSKIFGCHFNSHSQQFLITYVNFSFFIWMLWFTVVHIIHCNIDKESNHILGEQQLLVLVMYNLNPHKIPQY
jgi:hypothetical protein